MNQTSTNLCNPSKIASPTHISKVAVMAFECSANFRNLACRLFMISLAAQGQSIAWAGAIMTSFALGTSTIILLLAYGARDMINRRQVKFRKFAEHSKAITAALLICVGLAILLGLHKLLEVWFIKSVPVWFQDLSVTF